ncbi:hypothetical protein [Pontibacter chitinilyticus]|uniref:hypothetical protein n=1 Tax=Pontibacter chitinilyticus TaxID=2674989 RepID=UPI00321983AB
MPKKAGILKLGSESLYQTLKILYLQGRTHDQMPARNDPACSFKRLNQELAIGTTSFFR